MKEGYANKLVKDIKVTFPEDVASELNSKLNASALIKKFVSILYEKEKFKNCTDANNKLYDLIKIEINAFTKGKNSENNALPLTNNIWFHTDLFIRNSDASKEKWNALKNFLLTDNNYLRIRESKPKRNNLQLILYGAPGTGKSFEINKDLEGQIIYRTTFHPDTDYASFVGCYKPDMDKDNIIYSFIPQIFIKAYLKAWEEYITWEKVTNHPQTLLDEDTTEEDKEIQKWKDVYLVIEEINRGGCAQIFGDIFQLLDRDDEGWSQYVIIPDQDIAKYLEERAFPINNISFDNYKNSIKNIFKDKIEDNATYLALPPNFHIWATMNTSDQSLFPMDSAFKRRWDWEYVKIDYKKVDDFNLDFYTERPYSEVLEKINNNIKSLLNSADKQMGEFFVNPKVGKTISFTNFRDKILFYLFNDVFKGNKKFTKNFDSEHFLFEDLFTKDVDGQKDIVTKWIDSLFNDSANNDVEKEDSDDNTNKE